MKSWSVSSIRQFHQCSLAWFFKRTGVREEFKPLALAEGAAMHEVLAHHLRGMKDGKTSTEEESIEILEGAMLGQELEGEVVYGGKKGRDDILERLKALFRHWRANLKIEGTVAAVEEEIRVRLPGIPLDLYGFADLIVDTGKGFEVIDHKISASKRAWDDLLDPFDLQKLAMTRGYEAATGQTVTSWAWSTLTKTKAPAVHRDTLEVRAEDRGQELSRLAAIVNPSIALMAAVEQGTLPPVPTVAYARYCQGCQWRMACAQWSGSTAPSSALPLTV